MNEPTHDENRPGFDAPDVEAFIDSLSEDECRRILAVLMYGEHRCQGARIGCCGAFRCEPCHVDHLRARHGEHAAQFWNSLAQSSRLTWAESRHKDGPNSTNSKPRSKRKDKGGDQSRRLEVPSEIEQMGEAINRMRKILREQGYQV